MKLILASAAEDQDYIPWLERQIVRLDLADFVAELKALASVSGSESSSIPSKESLDIFLPKGITGVSKEQVSKLLKSPESLLVLQDLIYEVGSPYWDRLMEEEVVLPENFNPLAKVEAIWMKPVPSAAKKNRFTKRLFLGFATAICLGFIALVLPWTGLFHKEDQSRGLARVSTIESQSGESAEEYLHLLSLAVGDYKLPENADRTRIVKSIDDFLLGCEKLIAAPHKQLNPAQKKALVEKCQKWTQEMIALRESSETRDKLVQIVNEKFDAIGNAIRSLAKPIQGS